MEQKSLNYWNLVSSGIDWITATAKRDVSSVEFESLADRYLVAERQAGNFVKRWSFAGYEGFGCGSFACGSRQDGYYLRMSGSKADECWRVFRSFASNVSRLDLQVTLRSPVEPSVIVKRELRATRKLSQKVGRPFLVAEHRDSLGGHTMTIGSRTSRAYGRCYNKAAESRSAFFESAVRWEVETKGRAADFLSRYLFQMPRASVDVIPYVSKWFSDRRLGLGPLSQFSHRLMPCDMPQVPQVETDVSRKLEWLATQVQPSVEALIRAGKRDEVYRALGLEDS